MGNLTYLLVGSYVVILVSLAVLTESGEREIVARSSITCQDDSTRRYESKGRLDCDEGHGHGLGNGDGITEDAEGSGGTISWWSYHGAIVGRCVIS